MKRSVRQDALHRDFQNFGGPSSQPLLYVSEVADTHH
jgi:hypothetical protein